MLSTMIERLKSLFGANDAVIIAAILVLSVTAFRLPELKGFNVEYPTALNYTLTTIAQALLPFLTLIGLFFLYARHQKINVRHELVKGFVLATITFALALIGLPLGHDLYKMEGVGQGVAACLVLLTIWSVGLVVWSIVTEVLSSD